MVYHSMASVTTLVGESQGHHILPILQTLFPESLSHQLYHRLCKIMLMILQISEYFQQKNCSRPDRLLVRKPCSCSICVILLLLRNQHCKQKQPVCMQTTTEVEEIIKDWMPYIFRHLCSEEEIPISAAQISCTNIAIILYSHIVHEILQSNLLQSERQKSKIQHCHNQANAYSLRLSHFFP